MAAKIGIGSDAASLSKEAIVSISRGERSTLSACPPTLADAAAARRGGALERGLDVRAGQPRGEKGGDEGVARAGGVDRLDLRRCDPPAARRLPPPRTPAAPRLTTTSG